MRKIVNFDAIDTLKPDDVAKAMVDLIQDGNYGGGTVLEVIQNNGPKTRVIPLWNVDPPQGGSATKIDLNAEEIPKSLEAMKKAIDRDRGTAK